MINLNALVIAARLRLTGDATMMTLVEGVWRPRIPSTKADGTPLTFALPNIELGIQSETAENAGYGVDASDVLVRLMIHDRGAAPGTGSYDRSYAALNRADAVLRASPLTVSGQAVYQFRRESSIPESTTTDDGGFLRMAVGVLYRIRSQVSL